MQDEFSADRTTPCGEVIYRDMRAEAIAGGMLMDVSETAREVGFQTQVALTATAWSKVVAWSTSDTMRQTAQDEARRLWDVLWTAYIPSRRATGYCRVPFQLDAVPRDGTAMLPQSLTLHMHIGRGKGEEPAITIMSPEEAWPSAQLSCDEQASTTSEPTP
jgi:hypothetical protein